MFVRQYDSLDILFDERNLFFSLNESLQLLGDRDILWFPTALRCTTRMGPRRMKAPKEDALSLVWVTPQIGPFGWKFHNTQLALFLVSPGLLGQDVIILTEL